MKRECLQLSIEERLADLASFYKKLAKLFNSDQNQDTIHALTMQTFHGSFIPQHLIPKLVSVGVVTPKGSRIESVGLLVRQHILFPSEAEKRVYTLKNFDATRMKTLLTQKT